MSFEIMEAKGHCNNKLAILSVEKAGGPSIEVLNPEVCPCRYCWCSVTKLEVQVNAMSEKLDSLMSILGEPQILDKLLQVSRTEEVPVVFGRASAPPDTPALTATENEPLQLDSSFIVDVQEAQKAAMAVVHPFAICDSPLALTPTSKDDQESKTELKPDGPLLINYFSVDSPAVTYVIDLEEEQVETSEAGAGSELQVDFDQKPVLADAKGLQGFESSGDRQKRPRTSGSSDESKCMQPADKIMATDPTTARPVFPETADPQVFQCSLCPFSLDDEQRLRDHEYSHDKPFKCKSTSCPLRFPTSEECRTHFDVAHPEKVVPRCETCNKLFANQENLRRHRKIHSSERPYVCKVCPKTFKDSRAVHRHEKTHEEEMYQCDVCPKKYKCARGFKKHIQTHARPNSTFEGTAGISGQRSGLRSRDRL